MDSRIAEKPPAHILCQTKNGSCAACCGLYNFHDRSGRALTKRLDRRSALVKEAGFDLENLAKARDRLLAEEKETILFSTIRVCPFAGWINKGTVGCLIHPTRHPKGREIRDLSVHNAKICAGHFCASHDWLRPLERLLVQMCEGPFYGQVVTDAGLNKAIIAWLANELGGQPKHSTLSQAKLAVKKMWETFETWPYRSQNPNRFGRWICDEKKGVERLALIPFEDFEIEIDSNLKIILEALATEASDHGLAMSAIHALKETLNPVLEAMQT